MQLLPSCTTPSMCFHATLTKFSTTRKCPHVDTYGWKKARLCVPEYNKTPINAINVAIITCTSFYYPYRRNTWGYNYTVSVTIYVLCKIRIQFTTLFIVIICTIYAFSVRYKCNSRSYDSQGGVNNNEIFKLFFFSQNDCNMLDICVT